MKVIIIGAGIGGLTTAVALQQAKIEVAIYERVQALARVGAGLTLWANALNVFDAFGLGEALRSNANRNFDGRIYTSDGGILVKDDVSSGAYEIVVVHRGELQDLLLATFKGDLHLGKSAIGYENQNDSVRVFFEDGSNADTDLLIACDGIQSPIRQQMHPNTPPKYAGYTAWRAAPLFPHSEIGDMWGESWGHGQRFGIMPLSNERVYWFATGNDPPGKAFTPEQNKAILQKRFAGWHTPISKLLAETDSNAILHDDIYHINPLPYWVDGRVVLLGDSAHAMTPNMGQGACQAIEDAYVLAHYLRSTSGIATALKSYDRIRRRRSESVMKQSERIGFVGQLQNRTMVWLRNMTVRSTPPSITKKNLNTIVGYDVREEVK